LGLLANPAAFEFVSTVREADANALFASDIRRADVRLYGQAGWDLPVTAWKVVPGGQQVLPSAALGWAAGGEVPVETENNAQGNKAVEPFFEVRGTMSTRPEVELLDGRSGQIRFKLAPEPLLPRWLRSLWQLLQKRYQI
jgi:putative peptide zinc metalloprotease protein